MILLGFQMKCHENLMRGPALKDGTYEQARVFRRHSNYAYEHTTPKKNMPHHSVRYVFIRKRNSSISGGGGSSSRAFLSVHICCRVFLW
jgi:hypothetical protein